MSRPCATGRGGGVRWSRTADLPIHWCMKVEEFALLAGSVETWVTPHLLGSLAS